MCKWRKVRKAEIPKELRDQLERIGEAIVEGAMTMGADSLPLGVFSNLNVQANRIHIWNWLQERRDISERASQRMETAEWAVLIFVVIGTITEIATFVADILVLNKVS